MSIATAVKSGLEKVGVLRNPVTIVNKPAGVYFLGDPCYAMSRDDWDEFNDCSRRNFDINHGGFTLFGMPEDGGYLDDQGNVYGVDSGWLGLIPANSCSRSFNEKIARMVEFDAPFTCEFNDKTGIMRFGDIVIDTTMLVTGDSPLAMPAGQEMY